MKKGFTLIELIVVVAIIGLIAGVVIVSTAGIRQKAQAIKAGNDITNLAINMAMTLKSQGRNTWWTEAELTLGSNPAAKEIPGLLKKVPKSAIPGTGEYLYDNDGDILADNEAAEKGVNILIVFDNDITRDEYFELIDKNLDQGSGASRGRVRSAAGSMIVFNISQNPAKLGF